MTLLYFNNKILNMNENITLLNEEKNMLIYNF